MYIEYFTKLNLGEVLCPSFLGTEAYVASVACMQRKTYEKTNKKKRHSGRLILNDTEKEKL